MGRYFSKRALKRRLAEPSTWAGFAIIAGAFGTTLGIPPDITHWVVGALAVAAGVLPEGTPEA